MQKDKLLKIDLQLFADGGAAGAPTSGEGAATSESALPKAETSRPGSSRRGKTGALSNVVYGKQEDAPQTDATSPVAEGTNAEGNGNKSGVSTTSDTLEARRAAFQDMIDGEYKDIFTERTQEIINRRFKETKGMETELAAQKPIMDILMQKYKITDGDQKKLLSAIENDNQYWEAAADEAGLTVDQYKAMQKLQRENEELRKAQERQQGQQAAEQQLAKWTQEAESLKSLYPGFDFRAELRNREFTGLLRSGLPVQKAYELIHMDEIKEAAARSAAQTTGAQMQARIKAKASRPSENGTSSQSAAVIKSDVSNLSRADRAEIARRAQRGEKIVF